MSNKTATPNLMAAIGCGKPGFSPGFPPAPCSHFNTVTVIQGCIDTHHPKKKKKPTFENFTTAAETFRSPMSMPFAEARRKPWCLLLPSQSLVPTPFAGRCRGSEKATDGRIANTAYYDSSALPFPRRACCS